MKSIDWSQPQRQPLAGLAIVFLNTFWEVIKRLWPVLLLMLFGNKEKGLGRFESIALIFLVFTIVSAVLRFFYFRFYIEQEKLIIKSGWFRKETKIIPLDKVHSIHIESGPLHQALGVVKLSIDTAGSQKAEASIDALNRNMAEALKEKLEPQRQPGPSAEVQEDNDPVLQLTTTDLLRLSISANHLEAFFLFLSFGLGLYENLKGLDDQLMPGIEDLLPGRAVSSLLFLAFAVLIITMLVSTARIFLQFYHFRIVRKGKGFHVRSGLLSIRERVISIRKIQFVSWKANWVRRLMQLWILEFHVAGGDELKKGLKVQVPITRNEQIPQLVREYNEEPQTEGLPFAGIHTSFIWRRMLVTGIIPVFLLMVPFWFLWKGYVLFLLIYPMFLLVLLWCYQRKFRLWAFEDVVLVRKGIFGEEKILMQWHRIQAVRLNQSIYQRKHRLASITFLSAGGNISVPYIPLEYARSMVNFALFKTEGSDRAWM